MNLMKLLLIGISCLCCCCCVSAVGPVMNAQPTLFEQIQNEPQLSEFFNLVSRNELVTTLLKYRQGTAFAPTNDALRNFNGAKDQNFLLYHLANVALTTDKLDQSISTELPGNPPLWISRRESAAYDYDIYVNNARIARADITALSQSQDEQVLHIIDSVLEPIVSSTRDPSLSSPDAAKFLERASSYGVANYQLTDFAQQVAFHRKLPVFANPGRHTFFIPVNRGFEAVSRDKIDAKVIDGHVIPNVVMFTRPTLKGRPLPVQTLAFTDNLKVTVSFGNESLSNQEYQLSVQSNTLLGDYHHPRGVVVAQVVKANIPVRNGVVHLIHKPLIVIDNDIVNFLKDQRNGRLYEFYRVLKDYAPDFMEEITRAGELTLLAPSNEAFRRLGEQNLNSILGNSQKLADILQLHLVRRRLSSDDIIRNPFLTQVESGDRNRRLYFNAAGTEDNITLTVEGGGVNATILQADVGALNGIVHIIDRVLGIPSSTVREKLSTDPMMSDTYALSLQEDFISRLDEPANKYSYTYNNYNALQNYTFFVPSNEAWERVHRTMGSSYKKLFMGEFAYHVKQILERHLVVGRALRVADLVQQGRDAYVQTVRGQVKMSVVESGGEYFVEWEGIRARVSRPDVHCTNGVIHVLDTVLVKPRDITVSGQSKASLSILLTFVPCYLALLWLGH